MIIDSEYNWYFEREIQKNGRNFVLKAANLNDVEFSVENAVFSFPFSPNVLTYGAVSSANVKFKIKASHFKKGEVLNFKLYPRIADAPDEWGDGDSLTISLMQGQFKITESKSSKEKNTITEITAYDRLNFVQGKYIPSGTGKKSVSWLFADICKKIISNTASYGFTGSFVPYEGRLCDAEIDVGSLKGYSIRDALSFVASYVGCNVVVNNAGDIEMKSFKKVEYDLLNADRITTPVLAEEDTKIQLLLAKTSDDTKVTASSAAAPSDTIIFTNPIADEGALQQVLNDEAALSKYRTGTVDQMLGDPRIEPGDCLPLLGFEEEELNIPVMNLTLKFDGGLSAHIESFEPDQNENLTLAEKIDFSLKASSDSSNYAEAALNLSERINAALGLYSITVTDSMGASTYYLSDAPELEDATYIATMTAEGFAFASGKNCWNDGNPVWTSGMGRDGNAVIRALTAYKISADQINVTDLTAFNAKLAQWTIKGRTIYSAGTIGSILGVGLLKPTGKNGIAFYAGYEPIDESTLSEEKTADYDKNYKGMPLEYTTDWKDRTQFYVLANGTVVAKNISAKGSLYTENELETKKVEITNGNLIFSSRTTEQTYEGYGYATSDNFAYFTGELDASWTGKRFLRFYSKDGGVMISNDYDLSISDENDDKHWLNAKYYMFFSSPPQSGFFAGYNHGFTGDVKVIGTIAAGKLNCAQVEGGLTIGGNVELSNNYKYTIKGLNVAHIDDTMNLTIGSNAQASLVDGAWVYGETIIYSGLKAAIRLKNDTVVEGKLSATSLETNSAFVSRGQYIMSYTESGNLAIGGDSFTGKINIRTKAGENINLYNNTNIHVSLNVREGAWISYNDIVMFQYGTVGSETGYHFGIDSTEEQYCQGTFFFLKRATFRNEIKIGKNAKLTINDYTLFQYGTVNSLSGYHFGISGKNLYLWGNLFNGSGDEIATKSDERMKNTILDFNQSHEKLFGLLKPRTFKYNEGTSGRTHFGFIAQELEKAIEDSELTTQDVAAFVEAYDEEGNLEMKAIRYSEIIALNTHMLQKCLLRIAELEKEIDNLKEVKSNG